MIHRTCCKTGQLYVPQHTTAAGLLLRILCPAHTPPLSHYAMAIQPYMACAVHRAITCATGSVPNLPRGKVRPPISVTNCGGVTPTVVE